MIPDRPITTSEPPHEKAGSTAGGELAPIALDLFCQRCGYNLKGLTSNRCPECGKSLETVRLIEPQIPWVHRKRLGRFRAYWKTVYLAMFHQGRFCEEMARPVSYGDSQRFRWVTILHVYIPILLATICAYQLAPPEPVVMTRSFQVPGGWIQSGPPWFERAYAEIWPVVVLHVCFLVFLAAATGRDPALCPPTLTERAALGLGLDPPLGPLGDGPQEEVIVPIAFPVHTRPA